MSEIAELIARLEKATGPDRELDCLIGVAIGRFEARKGRGADRVDYVEIQPGRGEVFPGYGGDQLVPRYTESVDAAFALIPETIHVAALKIERNRPEFGESWHASYRHMFFGHAVNPAIALSIAALKARQSAEPANQ